MQDFGTKADNSPPPGGQLSAAEFNNLATENENAVLHSGQTLSGASDTQLAQSLFLHGVKAESFQDSGVANAYVATPISGASGVLLPVDYSAMNGAVILFKSANASTGASTLNIGQTTGALLGAKAIVDQAGAALVTGAIPGSTYVRLRYDSSIGAGSWVLLGWVSLSQLLQNYAWNKGFQSITASGNFTVPANVYWLDVEGWGGGGGGGGSGSGGGSAGGGGAPGYFRKLMAVTPGQVIAAVVGVAGSAGGSGGSGGAGGATTFAGTLSAGGGGGGAPNPSGVGGAGGTASGGDININGASGTSGAASNVQGGVGAQTPGGGGSAGGGGQGVGGAGTIPGGPGGGGGTSSAGGAGARGQINVRW